jgi:hypothetical protein
LIMPSDILPDDPETLKAMLLAERMQNERLRQIIKENAAAWSAAHRTPPAQVTLRPKATLRENAGSALAATNINEANFSPDVWSASGNLPPRNAVEVRTQVPR